MGVTAEANALDLVVAYAGGLAELAEDTFDGTLSMATAWWESFWQSGAAIDLARCTDRRAPELERRIVLSQYLTAVNCSGHVPPQETGLGANSWQGKFHLEMHWWHAAHFVLWGRPELLARSIDWYRTILPAAKKWAGQQGYEGARWPKQVGLDGRDSPNEIGRSLSGSSPTSSISPSCCTAANRRPSWSTT